MVFGLGQDINATAECAATAEFDTIRHMTFVGGTRAWNVPSPNATCTGKGFAPFSAVCWYFGKAVHQSLGGAVPVGLVASAVGGTAVEKWSGPDALAKCNQTGVVQQSSLWTPYIVPLLPLQLSGWTWYQAESNVACSTSWPWMPGLNCGIGCSTANKHCDASQTGCADFYRCQFPAMISDWKAKFNGGLAPIAGRARPFLFVELAPYTEGVGEPFDQSVALVREAQLAALALPGVAMAAAYDFGDTKSPLGNIHPEYKAPVGFRLGLAARALAYGEKIPFKNPSVRSAELQPGGSVIRLAFDAPVELTAPIRGPCPVAAASCAWLQVDGQNVTAASGPNGTVDVAVPKGRSAAAAAPTVAYLQGDWPVPFIYAAGVPAPGLPAAPFTLSATAVVFQR